MRKIASSYIQQITQHTQRGGGDTLSQPQTTNSNLVITSVVCFTQLTSKGHTGRLIVMKGGGGSGDGGVEEVVL
jgi:hypothetical protein